MLPQKIENMSEHLRPREFHSKAIKEIEESIRTVSDCSCSQCDVASCFGLRNKKSNSSCTCSLCKNPKSCGNSKKYGTDKKPNSIKMNDTAINNEIERIEQELRGEITKVAKSELDNREYSKFSSKNISMKRDRIEPTMEGKSYEKSSTRQIIHSVAINYLPKERKDSTAKLSAQIMNLPYQDFKDSLSVENPHNRSSTFSIKDIIKPDLFTKLKEIYEACSCKVCECITGKSLPFNNDVCDCKPCDCDECTKNNIKQTPHEGCPCVSCDRKDCRGVVKTNQDESSCSCKPCDCVECTENVTKSCDCEPCQCVECKMLGASLLRTLIVAPAHSNVQQNMCQCEPCECVNCTQNYNAMSSVRRQVSTEYVSNTSCHCESCVNDACQSNGVCRCDMQNKVMKKPIERANRDYDIHSTLVDRQKGSQFNNRDTIVTFALCNNSNAISYSKSSCNDCQCSKCECLVCNEKDEHKNEETRKFHSKLLNRYSKPCFDLFNTCKCSPCECHICSKNNKQINITEADSVKFSREINNCDCFVCRRLLESENDINDRKNSLFKDINDFSCEKLNHPRKGKILSPSTFDSNTHFESQLLSCLNNDCYQREIKTISSSNVSSNKSSNKKLSHHQNITACLSQSRHKIFERDYGKENKFQNFELPPENISLNDCQNEGLGNVVEDVKTLKKSITFIKGSGYADNKLCEIFNAKKENPISDIEFLEKFINLTKSSSKTDLNANVLAINENVTRDKYSINNIEAGILDREPTRILKISTNDSVHTILSSAIDSENINFENKQYPEIIYTPSSCILLCDKKSTSFVFDSDDFKKECENNITNSDNNFGSKLNTASDMNPDDLVVIPSTDKDLNDDSNKNIELNSDNQNEDFKVDKKETNKKSEIKLTEHKTLKVTKRCKGRKYNRMYSKLNKTKQKKVKAITNKNDIKPNDQTKFETKENSFSDSCEKYVYPVENDNVKETFEHPVTTESHFDDITKSSVSTTYVDKILSSENILSNIMETQTQNIDSGDNNDAWPLMRKNLYLTSPHVAKSKAICTIPAMEFDIRNSLKSISMQTSECGYEIRRSTGKHALTRLLLEVNNLLNSPLLQSSHSNNKSADMIQETNYFSKHKLSSEVKTARSDATSQTNSKSGPIDKETCCNLIQSMEALQRNIKHLMDNVLTNAVYKSELLTTKQNLVQGCTENMPKINSCKSSCHGLKATFVGLRTISDHTVMVKWRLPREVIYVQGYELQVDGRPVQKIFSPTRCMAILTCLPHSEKLLLTIRTLTTNILSDHQPATTIVYRPRVKCI